MICETTNGGTAFRYLRFDANLSFGVLSRISVPWTMQQMTGRSSTAEAHLIGARMTWGEQREIGGDRGIGEQDRH